MTTLTARFTDHDQMMAWIDRNNPNGRKIVSVKPDPDYKVVDKGPGWRTRTAPPPLGV
jgi:hypothetical protein